MIEIKVDLEDYEIQKLEHSHYQILNQIIDQTLRLKMLFSYENYEKYYEK